MTSRASHVRITRILAFMTRSASPTSEAVKAFPVASLDELTEAWRRHQRVPRRRMYTHRTEELRTRVSGRTEPTGFGGAA